MITLFTLIGLMIFASIAYAFARGEEYSGSPVRVIFQRQRHHQR